MTNDGNSGFRVLLSLELLLLALAQSVTMAVAAAMTVTSGLNQVKDSTHHFVSVCCFIVLGKCKRQ